MVDCNGCHGKDSAAQKDAWLNKPSRNACGACHDNVNFATGENHVNLPQPTDNQCANCHRPQGEVEFDASIKGLLAEAVFVKWGSEGYLEIDKRDIQSVNVVKKLFSKSCTVTLMDGSRHTFDYGAMNIDKVVGAIEAR